MFGKKKEKPRQEKNVYERKWCDLQRELHQSWARMDELFDKIRACKLVIDCFKVDTPDHSHEIKHLDSLQKSMLCACGAYDGVQSELVRFYDANKDNMEDRFCLNGLYRPTGTCHEVLRNFAEFRNRRR